MKTVQKIVIMMLIMSMYALSATLSSKVIYKPNKNINVQVHNQAADRKNWIGIYPAGSSNAWGNVITWEWTKGKNSVNMGGLPAGSYEARLFYNNSFHLEATTHIEVDANAARVKTTKAVYGVNENIRVDTRKFPNELKAWVGIYPAGSNNAWGNVVDWRWAQDEKIVMDSLPKGKYEVRLFYHNSFKLEASYPFSVGDNRAKIHTTSAQYAVGEKISVVVNGARAGQKDWVGIFSKNDNNSWANVYAWSFVEDGTTVLDESIKKIPAGEYEIRLFFNNEYGVDAEVRASYGFRVTGGANNNKVYPPETTLTPIKADRIERPAQKFGSYIDTAFNDNVKRTVTRVTNREQDKKGYNKHQYPKKGTAWNSDMSLLRLTERIYDAETLREIPLTKDKNYIEVADLMKSPESDASGIRWSKHNPNVLYVIGGGKGVDSNKFYELTINADRTAIKARLIINLTNETHIEHFTLGHNEGNIDYDDRYVVLSAKKGNDIYAILLDLKAKEGKHLVWGPKKVPLTKDHIDWISISPSGNYILVASYNDRENDRTSQVELYNRNFEKIRVLANRSEHGDIGYNKEVDGKEMFVQFRSGGLGVFGYILNNNPQYEEPIKLLDSNYGGGHISCRNYNRKGWCYVSTAQPGYMEVFALKLDGSKKVQRFAKSYGRGPFDPQIGDNTHYYWTRYQMGVPSPDGTRILFWSDHGNPESYLYSYKEANNWITTEHWYNRDTYEVRISK